MCVCTLYLPKIASLFCNWIFPPNNCVSKECADSPADKSNPNNLSPSVGSAIFLLPTLSHRPALLCLPLIPGLCFHWSCPPLCPLIREEMPHLPSSSPRLPEHPAEGEVYLVTAQVIPHAAAETWSPRAKGRGWAVPWRPPTTYCLSVQRRVGKHQNPQCDMVCMN